MKNLKKIIGIFILLAPLIGVSKIKVVTTTPSIKWAAKIIGGEKTEVESLLSGNEDPHYVDALPSFIFKAANADILCFVGLDLEVGWLPKVLKKSRNRKIQEGGKGYCDLGKGIKPLGVKTGSLDRSMGDVHGKGNPHYHLGPKTFYQAASQILNQLIEVDPKNAPYYLGNYKKLENQIDSITQKVLEILKPVKGKKFVEYHEEFTYFFKEFELNSLFAIESIPGVSPSAGRLARTAIMAKNKDAALVIGSVLSPHSVLKKFKEFSGVPFLQLPSIMSASGKLSDYETYLVTLAKNIREKSE